MSPHGDYVFIIICREHGSSTRLAVLFVTRMPLRRPSRVGRYRVCSVSTGSKNTTLFTIPMFRLLWRCLERPACPKGSHLAYDEEPSRRRQRNGPSLQVCWVSVTVGIGRLTSAGTSGTTLDAQARYANGTKSILENYLSNKPQDPQNIIVGLGMVK